MGMWRRAPGAPLRLSVRLVYVLPCLAVTACDARLGPAGRPVTPTGARLLLRSRLHPTTFAMMPRRPRHVDRWCGTDARLLVLTRLFTDSHPLPPAPCRPSQVCPTEAAPKPASSTCSPPNTLRHRRALCVASTHGPQHGPAPAPAPVPPAPAPLPRRTRPRHASLWGQGRGMVTCGH